jgi:hypothetical protein
VEAQRITFEVWNAAGSAEVRAHRVTPVSPVATGGVFTERASQRIACPQDFATRLRCPGDDDVALHAPSHPGARVMAANREQQIDGADARLPPVRGAGVEVLSRV